jgi:N utilization substance protein B
VSGANPKLRRVSRVSAVQALYQMDVSGVTNAQVVKEFLDHRFGYDDEPGMVHADEAYFEDIMAGVVSNQVDIDAAISKHLTEKWPLRRLDATLRALLRSATYEIMRRPDVPAVVIITEYMAIATDFFSGKEPGMVNGVLDKIAKTVRTAEFGLTASHIAPDTKPTVVPSPVPSVENE